MVRLLGYAYFTEDRNGLYVSQRSGAEMGHLRTASAKAVRGKQDKRHTEIRAFLDDSQSSGKANRFAEERNYAKIR